MLNLINLLLIQRTLKRLTYIRRGLEYWCVCECRLFVVKRLLLLLYKRIRYKVLTWNKFRRIWNKWDCFVRMKILRRNLWHFSKLLLIMRVTVMISSFLMLMLVVFLLLIVPSLKCRILLFLHV